MDVILEALTSFASSAVEFLPKLAAATILLVIGWIVGAVVGRIVKEILTRLKIDQYVAKGKKPIFKLSEIFPVIFSWSIYLVFIQSAVQILGIAALVMALNSILTFIPGLLKAIVVMIVGYALAEYISKEVESSKVTYSDTIAKILFFLIIYVSVAMALPLVGIDPTLVNTILLIIVGSVGAGLAIAIGLGLKDTVADMAKKKLK